MNTPARRLYAVLWWVACFLAAGVWMLVAALIIDIGNIQNISWVFVVFELLASTVPLAVLLVMHWIATGSWRWDWHW